MKEQLFRYSLLVCLALVLTWNDGTLAQNQASVYLDPADVTLAPGDDRLLSVLIVNANDLFGAEVHLAFDPSVIEVLDEDAELPGIQLLPGRVPNPENGFLIANEADNGIGELTYALTLLAPSEPVSGNGLIVAFEIRAIASGTSPLKLSVTLASVDGGSLPVDVYSGRAVVSDDQTNELFPSAPPGSSTPQYTFTASSANREPLVSPGANNTPTPIPSSTATRTNKSKIGTPTSVSSNQENTFKEDQTNSLQVTSIAETSTKKLTTSDQQPEPNKSTSATHKTGQNTIASIDDHLSLTRSEPISETDTSRDTSLFGGLILGLFLLFATLIFFGRRLFRRLN